MGASSRNTRPLLLHQAARACKDGARPRGVGTAYVHLHGCFPPLILDTTIWFWLRVHMMGPERTACSAWLPRCPCDLMSPSWQAGLTHITWSDARTRFASHNTRDLSFHHFICCQQFQDFVKFYFKTLKWRRRERRAHCRAPLSQQFNAPTCRFEQTLLVVRLQPHLSCIRRQSHDQSHGQLKE